MEVEHSVQRKYFKSFWHPAFELINEHTNNFNKNKAECAGRKIQALKTIAEGYISYVGSGYGDKPPSDKIFNRLLQECGVNEKVQPPILMLGVAILHELGNLRNFDLIGRHINQILAEKTVNSTLSNSTVIQYIQHSQKLDISHISLNSSSQSDDEDQIINNYAMITKKQSSLDANHSEIDSEIDKLGQFLDPKDQNFNSDDILDESPQIKDYLNRLSQASTELSYLCQKMKWSQPSYQFSPSQVSSTLFTCEAHVNVNLEDKSIMYKQIKVFKSKYIRGISKKEAKKAASLLLLRKIYNRCRKVWQFFKEEREKEKCLQQNLNSNNEDIFKNAKIDGMIKGINFKDIGKEQSEDTKNINSYLDKVKSCKLELNDLQGKIKSLSPPNYQCDPQDESSMWPVKASLSDGDVFLNSFAKDINKKKAEQKCARDLLLQIYSRHMDIFNKMNRMKAKQQKK